MSLIISNPVAIALQKFLDARVKFATLHDMTVPQRAALRMNNETIGNAVLEIKRLERTLARCKKSKIKTHTIILARAS